MTENILDTNIIIDLYNADGGISGWNRVFGTKRGVHQKDPDGINDEKIITHIKYGKFGPVIF